MTLREEIFQCYHDLLLSYKDKTVSKQDKEKCNKSFLHCEMDYQSLFQFGEGKRLITLHVKPSWAKFDSFLYQIYENEQDEIWLYWKKEIICHKIYKKVQDMSFFEFQNKSGLHSEMNKIFPPEKRKFSEKQVQTVRKLYQQKLKEDVQEIYGYDGTEFYLRIYSEPVADYDGWSHMPEEWKLFAELTKIVADVSEMRDKRFYTAKTIFHN